MSSTARQVLHEALLWAAVALGGLALFYFFDDLRSTFGPDGSDTATAGRSEPKPASGGFAGEVRLKADARGHFMFPAEVNGRSADFVADTGATLVVLTYEDAARLGLSPQRLDFNGRAETANGTARVAPVTLDRVRVEDITQCPCRGRRKGRAHHQSARHELPGPAQGLPDAGPRIGLGAVGAGETTGTPPGCFALCSGST